MTPYLYTYVSRRVAVSLFISGYLANMQFSNILLADIILTSMIAYGLWKSKTGWKDTDAMIKRIIM